MDIARFPADHPCRFFRDSDLEATLHWYPAPEGAQVFPSYHCFGVLSQQQRQWEAEGIGEVYGFPNRYNGGVIPPTAKGQMFFGTLNNFRKGCVFDPDVNVLRDDWGLAIECTGGEAEGFILQEPDSDPLITLEDESGFAMIEDS